MSIDEIGVRTLAGVPAFAGAVTGKVVHGEAGGIRRDFGKFLLDGPGQVVARFRPRSGPEDAAVLAAIESVLA